jgi:hypothetical protein
MFITSVMRRTPFQAYWDFNFRNQSAHSLLRRKSQSEVRHQTVQVVEDAGYSFKQIEKAIVASMVLTPLR